MLVGGLLLVTGYSFAQMMAGNQGMDVLSNVLSNVPAGVNGPEGMGGPLKTVLIVGAMGLVVGCYWVLQSAGWTKWAYWLVTLVGLVPQAPTIWSHNRLDWFAFGELSSLTPTLSQTAVGAVFLLSLVLLVTLHRVAEMRRFEGKLAGMNLEPGDRRQVMVGEWVTLAGLIVTSIVVTVTLLAAGMALGRMDQLLQKPPWTVVSVGGTAVILLSAFVFLWLRTRRTE